ncbi:hypothetical protein [Methanogenium cariaci]|nr:hypothetical protein [Methanogenium cariaci]
MPEVQKKALPAPPRPEPTAALPPEPVAEPEPVPDRSQKTLFDGF